MAQNLVTQVSRDDEAAAGSAAQPAQQKSLFSSIFCCFSNKNAAATPVLNQSQTRAAPAPAALPPGDPGHALLPQQAKEHTGKICLVLDLDETLVHSSFKPVPDADFVVPIEIDGQSHEVYVLKRPYVDEFLRAMAPLFEVVLFTASLSKYADPVTDLLDPEGVCRYRLFRQHCVFHRGSYVKDLSRLGRDLASTVIVDNSPASYIFQPDNAIGCQSWFDDRSDTELLDLIPFFENLAKVSDVTKALRESRSQRHYR
mmetsp:Transcript_29016/g.76055  ORF Transcript_29016/g.76055 Transcript_29016/m.76055 type:complete len:257 (+) Transcript_29016:158-928(+)